MKTQHNSSMYRSGTTPFSLPKISKLNVKQSRYNSTTNRSSLHINLTKPRNSHSFLQSKSPFTTRVQQEVLDQNQYPYTQTKHIQKQHDKLKDLLKQFNDETVKILEKYVIDKPVIKQRVKVKHPVEQMYFIRDKQSQNAHNIILILKKEVEKLESRCENLKYTSKQEFEHRIKQLKEQKHKIVMQNKEVSREITLNGLEMVRGKQSLVKQLEYEQFLVDSKRDRLKKESQSVKTQIASFQAKTKDINSKIDKYEQEESYTLKVYEELEREKSQNRLYEEMVRKKKILEHNKVMNQSSNYQLKHKYFQKLKELDEFSTKEENYNRKISQFEDLTAKAKLMIDELQKKESHLNTKFKTNNHGQNMIVTAKINFSAPTSAKININLQ